MGVKRKAKKALPGEPKTSQTSKKAKAVADELLPVDQPQPLTTFDLARQHLGPLVDVMAEEFQAPTAIQAQAWAVALKGRDLIAVAKTGSGKTCGYLLPALALIAKRGVRKSFQHKSGLDQRPPAQPLCLVLAPTRELVQQIGKEAKKFAVAKARVLGIYGGVPKGPQVKSLRAGNDLLVATPGRLKDFMSGVVKDPAVVLESVSYLVLDEADQMLDLGFEPSIRQIIVRCPTAQEGRQTLLFTATFPKDLRQVALHFLHRPLRVQLGQQGGGLATNRAIRQSVQLVPEAEKLRALKRVIAEMRPGETAMVFVGRKKSCDELEKELTWDPMRVEAPLCAWCRALHGDKEQSDRHKALAAFRAITENPRKGQKGVLIATDVASRGLDIPGVALVVIFDYAESCTAQEAAETYVHRIGRTGRAGKEGRAVTFFDPEKDVGAEKLCELLRSAGQAVPSELEQLAARMPKVEQPRRSKGKGKGKFGKGKFGKGDTKSPGKSRRGKKPKGETWPWV